MSGFLKLAGSRHSRADAVGVGVKIEREVLWLRRLLGRGVGRTVDEEGKRYNFEVHASREVQMGTNEENLKAAEDEEEQRNHVQADTVVILQTSSRSWRLNSQRYHRSLQA